MKHVSSGSFQAWRTPEALKSAFKEEFNLILDVAADSDNTLCHVFFDGSEGSDGLEQAWDCPGGTAWMNPPYRNTGRWMKKALSEVEKGNLARVVALVPSAVGVTWFTEACSKAEVHLFDKRICFELPEKDSLPEQRQLELFDEEGNPKTSPGGGNALVIIENDGLVGVTAMRSSETGAVIASFV